MFYGSRLKKIVVVSAASISFVHMIASVVDTCNFCGNRLLCRHCYTNFDNVVDQCIHVCSSLNLERSRLWYDIQQLSNDACTYLKSLDKSCLTMLFLGLDDDIVSFLLGDQYQWFRFICMSRIPSNTSICVQRILHLALAQ